MKLIDGIKRDRDRPRLTDDWRVFSDVPAPGWVKVIGPAFSVDGPTTATDLNGQDYSDRHRDARRIARVPAMEEALLAAVDVVDELEHIMQMHTLTYDTATDAIVSFRKALEQGNE